MLPLGWEGMIELAEWWIYAKRAAGENWTETDLVQIRRSSLGTWRVLERVLRERRGAPCPASRPSPHHGATPQEDRRSAERRHRDPRGARARRGDAGDLHSRGRRRGLGRVAGNCSATRRAGPLASRLPSKDPAGARWVSGVVGLGGLEPPASSLSGMRSNRLSYRPGLYRCSGGATRGYPIWRGNRKSITRPP